MTRMDLCAGRNDVLMIDLLLDMLTEFNMKGSVALQLGINGQ